MTHAKTFPWSTDVGAFTRAASPANATLPLTDDDAPGPAERSVVVRATWNSRTSLRPRRIVVGMDFSPASESARRLAMGIAVSADAVVDVVHVLDAFRETFFHKNADVLGKGEGILTEIHHALIRRQQMALVQGVRCVQTSLVGTPGIELARHAARTGADLIVLGDGDEVPCQFGWTWGRRAALQIRDNGRWRGMVLLRPSA